MDKKALKAKMDAANAKAAAIVAGAKAMNREMNDDELKAFDAAIAEADEADKALKDLEAKEKRQERIAGLNQPKPRVITHGEPESQTATVGATEVKARFEDDPKKGFKSHKDFIGAVIKNGERHPTQAKDERLKLLAAAGSDEMGEYDNSRGGFLVPEGFSPNVMQLSPEADPTGGVTNIPMSAPRVSMVARVDKDHSTSVSGGFTVSRRPETVAAGTSRNQLEKIELNAYSLFGGAYATEELLADSPISFAAVIAAGFRDQFPFHMINERINGTGVGEHMGIINSPCLISVSKETGQAAATITYNNLLAMRARSWGYSSAVWIANHNCLPQLAKLNQGIGTGGQLVYMTSAQSDVPDTLLGRPLYYSEHVKTLGTTGDILLCNWGEYLEGTYQPMQSAESIHVRFLNHERTFKFWMRNAGAPWWRTALTPRNGDTLSPFVSLATRS